MVNRLYIVNDYTMDNVHTRVIYITGKFQIKIGDL